MVDHALSIKRKEDAIRYLDLEGSYGKISEVKQEIDGKHIYNWVIKRSTHPWKEGSSFLDPHWGAGT